MFGYLQVIIDSTIYIYCVSNGIMELNMVLEVLSPRQLSRDYFKSLSLNHSNRKWHDNIPILLIGKL